MRWSPGGGSGQIEDRRGGGRGVAAGAGGLGVVGLVLALLFGGNPFGGSGGGGYDLGPNLDPFGRAPTAAPGDRFAGAPSPRDQQVQFIEFVVGDIQQTWDDVFAQSGQQYQPTQLVLFDQATQSGCGAASAATGPFYCPRDAKVYLDLSFFRDLSARFGAPGDFAQAYVIAHEFGHHVQNQLGTSTQVQRAQQSDPDTANELSVLLELQADCFAGIWGHSAYEQGLLEQGDLEEGLGAAAAIGDDRLQADATGQVDPDTWTHGSSEQRVQWFTQGFRSGDPSDCNTFEQGL